MIMGEDKVILVRNKIESFLRNKYGLILIGILLFSFIIRIVYFLKTYNQPMWWDEAEYFSIAKSMLGIVPYEYPIQRPVLFPLLIALFYSFTHSEAFVRFMVVLLPSVGCVFMTYLVGKSLYNKRVGLIASFIMSVFWVLMFNTFRVHTDALALLFGLLAVYFFWEGYVKKKDTKYLVLMGLFIALGFLVRLSTALIVMIVLIYLLLTDKFKFVTEKKVWYSGGIFILLLLPYLIWNYFKFGNFLAFFSGYVGTQEFAQKAVKPFAWQVFSYFKLYTQDLFFYLFLIGLVILLIDLILGFDILIKKGDRRLKAHLFTFLLIAFPTIYFTFIERSAGEPRWLMLIAPGMFFVIGLALIQIYKFVKKYNKTIALVAVLVLVALGGYSEVKYSGFIINNKIESYLPVKLTGLFIKDNSLESDIVLSHSVPQNTYYSERKTVGVIEPSSEFEEKIKQLKPRYLVLSVFEIHSEEVLSYPEKYQSILKPVQAYFADAEQTQPVLIVYEFTGYEF